MDAFAAWPIPVRDYLIAQYGLPTQIDPLRGLSHNRLWCVSFAAARVVLKATTRSTEAVFYQQIAPLLHPQRVLVPALEWMAATADAVWLVLEWIPTPLPRERWHADPELLAVLAHLHHSALATPPISSFCPGWTDTITTQALTSFPPAVIPQLRDLLAAFQLESQVLFTPECWISGDPNPTNWGIRADGTLVLYDWERFGRGTPALDLAITVPGLGTPGLFGLVAEGYLRSATGMIEADQPMPHELTRMIGLAKAWNAIEFLSMAAAGQVANTAGVTALVQALPSWLREIAALNHAI